VLLVLPLTALLSPGHTITAANGHPQLWVTNGPVYSLALAEHTLYLGGGFT
jgi:hypothetical protein